MEEQFTAYESERLAEIEALEESLEQKEQLIFESFETVKANAEVVGKEIAEMADKHGIEMSKSLTDAWKAGENAIASYGHALNAGTSQFISNLIGVETQTWQLQAQANATAQSLAYMFSTKADNLVSQLQASYTNEANLNQMTLALRDSLINTLERGYNISSVTAAFDAITSSANKAASAARSARDAFNSIGDANTVKDKTTNSNNTKAGGGGGGGVAYAEAYAKGGIVSKNKKGIFDPVAKSLGEDTMVAVKYGEGILTPKQTALVQKFVKNMENPKPRTLVEEMRAYGEGRFSTIAATKSLSEIKGNSPQISDKNMKNNINVHYDSLVTVNGDVNDTNHFLGQVTSICTGVVNKSWSDATRNMKYGF